MSSRTRMLVLVGALLGPGALVSPGCGGKKVQGPAGNTDGGAAAVAAPRAPIKVKLATPTEARVTRVDDHRLELSTAPGELRLQISDASGAALPPEHTAVALRVSRADGRVSLHRLVPS